MPEISNLLRGTRIVDDRGEMEGRFYEWTQQVTELQILTGTGTPEGNIEAPITTLYMDENGSSGSVLYIKQSPDVGGDRSKGWIAA